MQNEVKRKMIETGACNAVPKSPSRLAREEKFARHHSSLSLVLSSRCFCRAHVSAERVVRMPAGLRVENLAMLVTLYDERRFSSDAGASGARVLVTLIYEMIRRDVHRGIAALCLGGGNAVAMAVER